MGCGDSKIIIPKAIRQMHQWVIGQKFTIEDTADGILPRPKSPLPRTRVEDVASCLKYAGAPKTIEDMEDAIRQGVLERHDSD